MDTTAKFENYPFGIVALSNLVSLAIYGAGFYILYQIGIVFSALYLLFVVALEFRIIRYHCTNCYYWGKTCGFGKGRFSRLFFKKGDSAKFCAKKMTWRDMIPDLLISLIPFIAGIVMLIVSFSWVLLAVVLALLFLTTSGNGFVRGKLTCRYCKQAELGCPALELFNKRKT